MAMTAGTATISVDGATGAVTSGGTGMAATIAASMTAIIGILAPLTATGISAPVALSAGIAGRRKLADMFVSIANAVAAGVVTEITTNGVATITTSTVCGRMPASTTQHTPIEAPSGNVTLAIS